MGRTLAIDLGSSSIRAAVLDERLAVLSQARRAFDFRASRGSDGTFAAEPVAVLLAEALGELDAGGVTDVAVSALWHSLLVVDHDDRPVSEVFTWESTSPAAAVPALRELLDAASYRARTGSYLHPSYPLASLWLLTQRATDFARATDLGSWVLRRVLGVEVGWSRQIVAGSGLWHQVGQRWDAVTRDALGLDDAALGEVWTDPVELDTAEAARFGLRGAVLHPVFGDGACNNIGVQAVGADTAALSAGTSGSIRLLLPDVIEDAPCGLWRYQLDGATTAIGGANSNVGNLFEWSRSRLGDAPPTALLAGVPPELGGLVALPHLVGERGPRYRSEASGALIGLRPHHDREDLVSALVLASLGTFHELAGLAREASPSVERAIVAGGVTSAAPWYAQLLADAIALPVTVSTVRESSLSGAASLATGIRPHADPGVTYRPRIEWTKAIEAQSRRARALEDALAQVP